MLSFFQRNAGVKGIILEKFFYLIKEFGCKAESFKFKKYILLPRLPSAVTYLVNENFF